MKNKLVAVVLILALCTPAFAVGQDKIGHFRRRFCHRLGRHDCRRMGSGHRSR